MAKLSRPRFGSLQFWPRKRAKKFLPRVNWRPINAEGILGFLVYKAGMVTALVKDTTDKSMTAGKKIAVAATVLEAPPMKIYSVRFYKAGVVLKEVVVAVDKELKHKLKVPKQLKSIDSQVPEKYDDIRIIVYSLAKQTKIKKTPDLAEISVSSPDKLAFVKNLIGKEISIKDVLKTQLVDARGLTIGKGFAGPVKRFGISLKQHKSEKGVRRPGSLGPWHPAHVTFRVAMAGQLGFFSRVHYNHKVLTISSAAEKNIAPPEGFKHYGNLNSDYVLLAGSIQGPPKRQLLLTPSFRPTKKQAKKRYELLETLS